MGLPRKSTEGTVRNSYLFILKGIMHYVKYLISVDHNNFVNYVWRFESDDRLNVPNVLFSEDK
jgi:hypothetical protein